MKYGAVAQFGSASEWHSEGRGFDPHQLHFLSSENKCSDQYFHKRIDRIIKKSETINIDENSRIIILSDMSSRAWGQI